MAISNIGCMSFFQALAAGSVACLRKAFNERAEFVANVAQSYNDMGETPLLLAIKNRNFKTIKFLINELKVSVIQVGQLTWKNVDYTDVTPLFAAIISNQLCIINCLVDNEQYNPTVDLTQHPLLLSSRTTRLQKIRTLELIGAAYIFYGNRASRLHGYSCWRQGFLLCQSSSDSDSTIPKVPLQLSNRGGTALRNKLEVQTLEQLERLKIQRRAHWKVQAFLVSRRISSELDYFPNLFTVVNLFNFSLRKWSDRQLGTNRALRVSLFFIELFDNQWWENYIEDDAMIAWEVINNTLHYLCAILELLSRLPNHFSFSDLMFILRFACNHLQKTYINYWPTSILYQTRKNEISNMENLIVIVVTLITEKQNIFTPSDIQEFKQCFSHHVFLCGQWQNEKSNLLLKACAVRIKPNSTFEVIRLLLQMGANPNYSDEKRNSPLHLLALQECTLFPWNDRRWNPLHGRHFSATVQAFLEAGYHEDQINEQGETALECIKVLETHAVYPDAEFQSLLNGFLQDPRPLSCFCARVINKHRLPIDNLPSNLQIFVRYH